MRNLRTIKLLYFKESSVLKKLNFLLVIVLLSGCDSDTNATNQKEYFFSPIGWKFHLPDYWISQKGSNIEKTLEKYGDKLRIDDAQMEKFRNQQVFMMETSSGFNKFTSEVSSFSGSELEFENGIAAYKNQLMSQLKEISPEAEINVGDVNEISIDGQKFSVFETKFKFVKSKNDYFYMQVYMGNVNSNILLASYTCIHGSSECKTVKQAFESSTFKKI